MPLVKQTGVGSARRNLSLICDVFLLGTLLMGVVLTAPGCCAKIETQIKLLNDDYTMPTRIGNHEDVSFSSASSSASASSDAQQQPTVPQYNSYKNDLKRISYETIHRILRDENEPMIYRTNDLRYFKKRSSSSIIITEEEHEILKRSVMEDRAPLGIQLNLTGESLTTFSRQNVNATHQPLEDITSIILQSNSLREFPLTMLPNLNTLDLSVNNFTHFEVPSESTQLRVLNLNQNRIVNFTTSIASYNLHELHLKDNQMRSLAQFNLSRLNELEILDLSCNQLENLETAFFPERMKNLKYLNLARNRLQCIYRETFYNLLSMNTLVLSYNEITEIDYETFLALPNLQYLDLSHNQLRGDSIRALQGIPDLVGLSIAYNWRLGDSMQEFVASWSLKELDASGTGLCKIPAALAQSVRTLKLADNWLTTINCGDLDSYPLLQYLDLSHSHIDEIEEDALGRLEILETLFLDHNNLKRIPISLPTSLEYLFLHNNQIMDIQLQSFQGLNNLKALDLSSNKLLYLPDLPLPKLLTLNLQSSGINGLHQAIVKTSPHLRDLYLEDNPIKCADLLGIAEWASPCRNDRRITERINIKSHYVRMHNYFESFQCGNAAVKCGSCMGDISQIEVPRGNAAKPNCLAVNGLGKLAKTPLEERNNEQPNNITTETTFIRKTNTTSATATSTTSPAPTTSDANQDEPKRTSSAQRSSAPQLRPTAAAAAQPEVSTQATITTTMDTTSTNRIQTNSTDKISASPQQKQLPAGGPYTNPGASIQRPSQIKPYNNYVETSAQSGSSSSSTPTTTHRSLLSQEYTGKSQKGLKAQSDNATKVGHNTNGEISVATTAAKSNFPTTTTKAEEVQANTTMAIRQIPREKGSNEGPSREQHEQEQHQKLQEILHTKDRHLIGTPLLMHKGHVVLVPPSLIISPTVAPTTTTATITMATTATNLRKNLLHLAPRQDTRGSTIIPTSKEHKLETIVSTYLPNHYQQQQQGYHQNAIIKGAKKKLTSRPLGQENHYQDIQTQHQHKVHPLPMPKGISEQKQHNSQTPVLLPDKKDTSTQQKFRETTAVSYMLTNDNSPTNNDKARTGPTDYDKQFAKNLERHHSSHSLNTPLDGQIASRVKDVIFKGINEATVTFTEPSLHHSRVNTPLLKNDDDLQILHTIPNISHRQSMTEGHTRESTLSLIKLDNGPRAEGVPPQQQHTAATPERWLDIRKASRHPGLVVVIGVTFTMVLIVGLVQVYRYRQKPLNFISHRHYGYHPEPQQYQEQDYQQHYHCHQQYPPSVNSHHHEPSGHHLSQESQLDTNRCSDANNHNQCSNYGCNDNRTMMTKTTSSSSYNSPHHLQRIHELTPPVALLQPPSSSSSTSSSSSSSNYEIPSEKFSSGYATNRGSTTSNYRLFQLNGKRIKHNHHSSMPTNVDDDHDFYTEMNHGPQTVLANDFFPMELLSAPSRIQPASTIVRPSTITTTPHTHAHPLSLLGGSDEDEHHQRQSQHQQNHRKRIDDDDFKDIPTTTTSVERSKFEIW